MIPPKPIRGGTFDIYTSPERIGEKKIGLIEESGDQPLFRGPLGLVDELPYWRAMQMLSALPRYSDYAGFLLYNKTFNTTHYMMSPTPFVYYPLFSPTYSRFLFRPFMFINGSVNLDFGEPVNIWEWAETGDLTAEYQIEQKRNDSVESYNVLCEVKGKNQNKTIMISGGHHDFFWGQGASDNAAGVAIMLGILKWLNQTNIIPEYNLTFVSFSGEEVICRGSGCHVFDKRFASMNENMTYMLNFDWLAHNTSDSTLMLRVTDESLTKAIKWITARTNYNETFQEETYRLIVKQDNVSNDAHPFFRRYVQGVFNSEDVTDLKIMDMGKVRRISGRSDVFESRHRSGANHTKGDSLDNIDFDDLNITADIALNITRFLILEPPENQFVDCEFTPFDICGDTWNDSVNITFNVTTNRTSWVTVEADIRNATTGDVISGTTTWLTVYKALNTDGWVWVTLPPTMHNDTYNVTIRLFDDKGNLDDECYQLVNLSPYGKPIAYFNYFYDYNTRNVNFYDMSIPSPGAEINEWHWDFGDGGTSSEPNPSHFYLKSGTYTVTLTVGDTNGLNDSWSVALTVPNSAPYASFTISANPVLVGTELEFISTSYDEDGIIENYMWCFGDGAYSYEENPVHAYSKSGLYTVTLTVTDDDGATNTTVKTDCLIVADAFVDDSYPSDMPFQHKWKTLQAGIDDPATENGVLYVFNGTYASSTITTPITIIGESPEDVKVIPGFEPVAGLRIESGNVTVSRVNVSGFPRGFEITDGNRGNVTIKACRVSGSSEAGIMVVNLSDCIIEECILLNNTVGIHLINSSHNVIKRTDISDAQYGVYLSGSSGNWIGSPQVYDWYPTDCTFTFCDYAIYLADSDYNYIIGCTIDGTLPQWMIHLTTGIYLDNSHYNTISTCLIYNTTSRGIYLSSSSNNKVEHCKIVNNFNGIELLGSSAVYNLICQNNISLNSGYAVYMPPETAMNRVVYNDFIGNGNGQSSQVFDANGRSEELNHWCKEGGFLLTVDADGEGNYWSDYEGEDSNGDGVGDTPYIIQSGRVQREDTYPLMHPYGWCVHWG